jgi:RIP metalloprotease RseP
VVGALIVSIFLHELGHFLAAKQAGMKVTEYFLGFGPKIFSFRRGETEYGVKVIPAGAYVRIIGMNDLEEVEPGDEGRTYREKGYWARLRVVLAGPAMNFLIAFVLLFAVVVAYGQQRPDRWTIKEISAGTAAAAAGLQPGDRIVSVAGQTTSSFDNMGDVVHRHADQTVDLVIQRQGGTITVPATLGWGLGAPAAAQLSPLDIGDRIDSIGGQATTTYAAARQALSSAPAGTISVEFVRGDNRYRTEVNTPVSLPDDGSRGFLGIKPSIPRQRLGPIAAVSEAGSNFKDLAVASVQGFGKLFSPTGLSHYATTVFTTSPTGASAQQRDDRAQQQAGIVPLDAGTPSAVDSVGTANQDRFVSIVGIVGIGSQLGKAGLLAVLLLIATVNFFLGLINLVPLPPFDGGHAAIATYEAIRGRITGRAYRADMAKLMPVAYAVFGLLVFVGLSSMYLDLVDPVRIGP